MVQRLLGWIVILAGCVLVVSATRYGFSPVSTTGSVEWRLIDVPPHTSAADLADRLQRMGLIRSKVCFLVAARLRGESGVLQPGQYKVSPNMGPVDIV
ncbi:MAG: endolytic transglycosylase MltG, partial [Chloroflexi bacterium]|nr:endolytic transglycosylase MltG [Chloroflexota bacterium]